MPIRNISFGIHFVHRITINAGKSEYSITSLSNAQIGHRHRRRSNHDIQRKMRRDLEFNHAQKWQCARFRYDASSTNTKVNWFWVISDFFSSSLFPFFVLFQFTFHEAWLVIAKSQLLTTVIIVDAIYYGIVWHLYVIERNISHEWNIQIVSFIFNTWCDPDFCWFEFRFFNIRFVAEWFSYHSRNKVTQTETRYLSRGRERERERKKLLNP